MPDTTRTFVAVTVPEALGPKLRRLQQDLIPEVPGAKWVDVPPFHATLAFLGDVPHVDLNDVCKTVAGVAAGFPPLELALTAPGAFPDAARPRVIWAGVGGPGLDGLMRLQAALAAALARSGYPGESQPFHPHVTLARLRSGRDGGRWRGRGPRVPAVPAPDVSAPLERRRRWSAGPFRVGEVVTFSSTLTPDGPVHAPLARAPLRAGKA
jgi:RNA 2',3'-cyclic 3'-phosphodiesterase